MREICITRQGLRSHSDMRLSCEPFSCSPFVEWKYFCVCVQTREEIKYCVSYLKRFVYEFRVCNRNLICNLLQDVISECPPSFIEWAYVDKISYLHCRLCNAYTSTLPEDSVYLRNRSNDDYVRWATRLCVRRWDHTMSAYTYVEEFGKSFGQDVSTHSRNSNCVPAKYKSGTPFEVTYFVGTVDILIYYFYTCLLDNLSVHLGALGWLKPSSSSTTKMDSWKRTSFACTPAIVLHVGPKFLRQNPSYLCVFLWEMHFTCRNVTVPQQQLAALCLGD